MTTAERRTSVAGWILGRALGMVQQPMAPFSQPAYVWDTESRRWLPFPNPLLTPPTSSEFIAEYDWLPAILESLLIAIAQSHQPPVMSSMLPYRALRRIHDDGTEDPVAGQQTLAARTNITRWLRTGDTGTGIDSAIPGTAAAGVSIDDRSRLLLGYLQERQTLAAVHYMAPGEGGGPGEPGAPGGGTFSVISLRAQASKTPIFHDVAPDIFWATKTLIGLIPDCAEDAKRPEVLNSLTPQPPSGTAPQDFRIPQLGGSFEVPQGGTF
jgi:hypothetical protein